MKNLIPVNPLTDITRIEYRGQLVLTTAQLAEFYETSATNLSANFKNNEDRFIKGKHYFKVVGDELKVLRNEIFDLQISTQTRVLYLWTKKGCARHCKSVGTDRAWEVFELLEDTYFNQAVDRDKPLASVSDFERGKALTGVAQAARDPYMKKRLVALAANLILGREEFPVPVSDPVAQLTLFKDQ